MALGLSERQNLTIGTAATVVAVVVILCAVGAIFWLIGTFFAAFSNVFLPLAVAAVLALVLRPYYVFLHERLRFPKPLALITVFLSIVVPIGLFMVFFGAMAIGQISDLVGSLPDYWQRALDQMEGRWPRVREFLQDHQVAQRIRSAVEEQSSGIVQGLQVGLQSVGDTALNVALRLLRMVGRLLGWAVLPVYFSFFIIAEPGRLLDIERFLPFLKAETRRDVVYLVHEFVNILVAFFRGQLIVAFLQGCLFALGFSLVGLRFGLILGLMLGFLNIIPYLGSIVGLAIALPLGLVQEGGGLWLVVAVLIVFTIVQCIEGYVLTPKVMGDRTGLHPMVIIVAVFFWGSALNGIAGMILAIPLTAFLVIFWRLLREKYISEWL